MDIDFGNLLGLIVLSALVVMATVGGVALFDRSHLRDEAIERGYALHCPSDGSFAWVGECEGDE